MKELNLRAFEDHPEQVYISFCWPIQLEHRDTELVQRCGLTSFRSSLSVRSYVHETSVRQFLRIQNFKFLQSRIEVREIKIKTLQMGGNLRDALFKGLRNPTGG